MLRFRDVRRKSSWDMSNKIHFKRTTLGLKLSKAHKLEMLFADIKYVYLPLRVIYIFQRNVYVRDFFILHVTLSSANAEFITMF